MLITEVRAAIDSRKTCSFIPPVQHRSHCLLCGAKLLATPMLTVSFTAVLSSNLLLRKTEASWAKSCVVAKVSQVWFYMPCHLSAVQ